MAVRHISVAAHQKKRLNTALFHKVLAGQNLTRIAKKHGVTVDQLVRWNKIDHPDLIQKGQVLRIRAPEAEVLEEQQESQAQKNPGPAAQEPTKDALHVVSRGESLWRIATRYKISVDQLRRANNIHGDLIHPEQKLNIPSAEQKGALGAILGGQRLDSESSVAAHVQEVENRSDVEAPQQERYVPHSAATKKLYRDAIPLVKEKLPELLASGRISRHAYTRIASSIDSWPESKALHRLLDKESGGWVGRPNFELGSRRFHSRGWRNIQDPSKRDKWPEVHEALRNGSVRRSTASGLGMLQLANVKECYPNGVDSIGNATEEAAGMLVYIADRYGSPEKAWEHWVLTDATQPFGWY